MPLVSIITINFNMRDGLAETMSSVASQTFRDAEYIIVDGGSTDGSAELIAQARPPGSRYVSEPDRGIYDAMNKGVRMAAGDWIIFLNSGDVFHDAGVLADVFAREHDCDLLYGNNLWRYPALNYARLIKASSPDILPYKMHCSHQSLFTRRTWLQQHPFRLDVLAADYQFLLSAWIGGARFEYIDRVISIAEAGGASDRHRLKSLGQRLAIVRAAGLATYRVRIAYLIMAIEAVIGSWLHAHLPANVARKLMALKRNTR